MNREVTSKYRLAILNRSSIHYSYGGISPFIKNLDPFLRQHFEVDYIILPDELDRFDKIPKTLMYFLYILFSRKNIRRYDFVISHVPESSYAVSFFGVPYLHIFHGNFNPMSQSRFWYGKYFMGLFDHMLNRIKRTAALKYTVGNANSDIPKILNPIHHRIRIKDTSTRRGFIFSGRLEKIKNIDRIIKVFSRLPQSLREQHKLFIAGKGTQEGVLKELVSTLQMADQVIFLGNLPNEALIEEVSGKKILLMASRQEGFPMAIAEAFSVGIPVIATDTGDISTFLRDGFNGALHKIEFEEGEYATSIERILNDYETYAVNALASSRVFDAENIAQQLTADIHQYFLSHAYSFHS